MAAMIPGVSQPEIQRQVRQQRADIDALYELVERVDQKVDALDVKLDRRDSMRTMASSPRFYASSAVDNRTSGFQLSLSDRLPAASEPSTLTPPRVSIHRERAVRLRKVFGTQVRRRHGAE